jgi:hypothetical protein
LTDVTQARAALISALSTTHQMWICR